MPTITLSWTDLALFGLTAGLVGSILLIGRSSSSSNTAASSDAKKTTASKKKKTRSKKPNTNTHSNDQSIQSSPPSPVQPPKPVSETPPPQPQPETTQSVENSLQHNLHSDFPPLSNKNNKDQNNKKNDVNRPQRPFAERHAPPVRRTVVDDMIDPDVEKPLTIARVMNIVNPAAKPQDPLSLISDPEEGWEKVPDSRPKRSRNTITVVGSTTTQQTGSTTTSQQASQNKPSKRQRQNAKKKEAAKALKAADEADRLRQLAAHKRDQERLKINAQSSTLGSNTKSSGKQVAGGMSSSIGEDGRLIWE